MWCTVELTLPTRAPWACIIVTSRLGQTDPNAVPMAGKSKAPQSEVDKDLAGQDAEVAAKTHVHWIVREAEKGTGARRWKTFPTAKRPGLAHVSTRCRVSRKLATNRHSGSIAHWTWFYILKKLVRILCYRSYLSLVLKGRVSTSRGQFASLCSMSVDGSP